MGDVTRIAIESDGSFRFKPDRLHNPERIFFDLSGAKPQVGGRSSRGTSVIPVGDRLLRQIRIAETQHGITRIVLDVVDESEDYTTSLLENPERLIVELHARVSGNRPPADRPVVIDQPALPVTRSVAPDRPAVVERAHPRIARLDFSEVRRRREEAVAQPGPHRPRPTLAVRFFAAFCHS